MRPSMNSIPLIALASVAMVLPACQSNHAKASETNGERVPASAPSVALPDAEPALVPLAFMTGRWALVNPNKSVNREHWMSPHGATMVGIFQQLRRDGSAGFYEVSAIVAEKDGVMLYHRHLHPKLAIDAGRKDVDVFKLRSAENGRAVFEPVTGAAAGPGGIETMTYRLDGPDALVQELAFKADSKEKGFSTVYSREK